MQDKDRCLAQKTLPESWVKVKPSSLPSRPPSPRELGVGVSQKHSGQAQGGQSNFQK